MIYIFFSVICLLLLTFLKNSMEILHPIIALIVTFTIFYFILFKQAMPLFTQLKTMFNDVPYASLLVSSLFIIIISEFIRQLFLQFEYDAIAYVIDLSSGFFLVALWIKEFIPLLHILQTIIDAMNISV